MPVCLLCNGDPVFLRRAVDSVLQQKEADFEVLLADDGSEAEFGEIADKLAQEEEERRAQGRAAAKAAKEGK